MKVTVNPEIEIFGTTVAPYKEFNTPLKGVTYHMVHYLYRVSINGQIHSIGLSRLSYDKDTILAGYIYRGDFPSDFGNGSHDVSRYSRFGPSNMDELTADIEEAIGNYDFMVCMSNPNIAQGLSDLRKSGHPLGKFL